MATNSMTHQADASSSLHHQLLHRLVAVAPGATSAELQLMYEGLAPLAYRGTTSSPVQRRRRREVLSELVEGGVVEFHDTSRGRVWVPITLPDEMDVRHAATDARESRGEDDV
jgi:hypothetical protein